MRPQQSMGDLFHNRLVAAKTEIPVRTGINVPVPYRRNKHVLFGQQEGRCNVCGNEFPFRVLVLQRRFKEGCSGMREGWRAAWRGSVWPVRWIPGSAPATASTHPVRTVPGAASP